MARARRANQQKPDFHRQTVLFQWALGKFGVKDLKGFTAKYQIGPDNAGGILDRTGTHQFYESIANALSLNAGLDPSRSISIDRLSAYEQNILQHTLALNKERLHHGEPEIKWMYFQYLALVFTEMYLDRYFDDPDALRDEINAQIAEHNERSHEVDHIQPFALDASEADAADAKSQLARLAFWCATGSGKTLLMMMNIRQFKHYHKLAYAARKWPALDQIIIVTPNDGLSRQHLEDFKKAGFDVMAADDSGNEGLFASQAKKDIKIISIHKFQEEHGKSTVALEAFEGCNLVLVDEGHRGAGRGEEGKWMERRDQLSRDGFCIEYSATFKEAIGNDEYMRNRYARSTLFDYAYRSFYRDGYGKDFTILNLDQDDAQRQRRYLTAALLLFYQQLRVWRDGGDAIRPFLIEKPLWVFVGHTVAGKVSSADDKGTVSDVVDVLLFLNEFLAKSAESRQLIESLLTNGFQDQHGHELLADRLPHLNRPGDKHELAARIHEGILRDVFNAPGGGALTVQMLKGKDTEGELAVRVGDAEPFGVVNVGDPSAVAEACHVRGINRREDDLNRDSLFRSINTPESTVNLLVGSRKFTEGWNSWRVSSIGLMRMGKSEGTQIIQLFGRGVRLRGYQHCLRRSLVLATKPPEPQNLRQVETLQVFGVKASYMATFRQWIQDEVPEALERKTWELPVVENLPAKKLKTLRLREEIDGVKVDQGQAFRRLGPIVCLRPPDETSKEDDWLRRHRVRLNWLPRIHGIVGANTQISRQTGVVVEMSGKHLDSVPLFFFDVDELLFGLEAFKATRGLDRLHVDRTAIMSLLKRHDWYELFAADDDVRLDRFENRVQWQRMAQQLLNSYAERFYKFTQRRWEAPYIEVVDLASDDPSMVKSYDIESTSAATEADINQVARFVEQLHQALQHSNFDLKQFNELWRTVPFAGHVYQPLMYVGLNAVIRVRPVALDKHETKFVTDLAQWCQSNSNREVFLLRNQAVNGLGFFLASNFYPDFLLWLCDGEFQHLVFVDPHGLQYANDSDPKVRFATSEVPRLQGIVDRQTQNVRVHAFILSTSSFATLNWSDGSGGRASQEDMRKLGIFFMYDDTKCVNTLIESVLNPTSVSVE